jgi:hypothetical protein
MADRMQDARELANAIGGCLCLPSAYRWLIGLI